LFWSFADFYSIKKAWNCQIIILTEALISSRVSEDNTPVP